MSPRNVIIDCDTGVDDALALLLALRSPEFNVLGITNVAGNVPVDKVVRNTLVVVEHSGKEVPVYQGATHALTGGAETAEYAHGSDGLADIGFPEPKIHKQDEHAVEYLVRSFMDAREPIDLITLAPLTNIALALLVEPRLEERIHSLLMMAGGIAGGNSTPAAEFNVWVDPEAAEAVFRSRIPKTMVALDPIRQGGGIYAEDVDRLEKSAAPWCWMASRLLRVQLQRWEEYLGRPTPASPPDLAAMGVAIDCSLAEAQMLPVVVETAGKHTRGMTLVDRREGRMRFRDDVDANVNTVLTIDNERYRKLVLDTWLAD